MKSVHPLFYALLFAFLGTGVRAETLLQSFDRYHMDLLAQTYSPDCAPISFFDAMILTPPNLKMAIQRLPGKDMYQKYHSFLNQFGTKPSQFSYDRPRFKENSGIDSRDLADMANDLTAGKQGQFSAKFVEQNGNYPLNKTLDDLTSSVKAGFAPILFLGFMSPDGKKYLAGHAIALLDITNIDDNKITTIIFNPDGFDVTSLEISADDQGLLRVSSPGMWPPDLPNGLMTLQSYMIFKPIQN